jgi:uncharacterized protein YbjT (DUF2867 family)
VLVAGAGGILGRRVVDELARRGDRVRAIVRGRADFHPHDAVERCAIDGLQRSAWAGSCDGVDVVVSCLGAPVSPSPWVGRRTYTAVDAPANVALVAEALRAGVRRFVYVSLLDGAASRALNYAEGHEQVVDALRESGIPATILRPTGFFASMGELVGFARRGIVPVIGDGLCRTNPIHEADVALAAADAAGDRAAGLVETPLGGPEEFTRRDIAAMAFAALGRRPRLLHVPPGPVRAAAGAMRLVNPRAADFQLFAVHVMTHPCIAPRAGTSRLADYFIRLAQPAKR